MVLKNKTNNVNKTRISRKSRRMDGDSMENQEAKRSDIENEIQNCTSENNSLLQLNSKNLYNFPLNIAQLSNLQYLYLKDNQIEEIPSSVCLGCRHLKWLDLRNNRIKSLPEELPCLSDLKNLLLENNKLASLPLSLGLLENLSGLNISGNPLTFPPTCVIEEGTKKILEFLRIRFTQSMEDVASEKVLKSEEIEELEEEAVEKVEELTKITTLAVGPKELRCPVHGNKDPSVAGSQQHHPVVTDKLRRISFEETLQHSPPYIVNSLDMRTRKKATRPYMPPLLKRQFNSAPAKRNNKSKGQSIEFQHAESVRRQGEQHNLNNKADAIIHQQKSKQSLESWRKKARKMQREKKTSQYSVNIPFGNDLKESNTEKELQASKNQHAEQVHMALKERSKVKEMTRNRELETRINEHVDSIREWRRKERTNTEVQLKEAKNNLDRAMQLQKELEEKRSLEYRLRAFIGDD